MIAQPIELAAYYGWPCSQTCSARITPASMGDGDPYWGMDPLAAGEGPAYLFRVRMCSESRSTIVDLLRFELYGRCLCSASPSTPLRLELYGRFLCSDSARTLLALCSESPQLRAISASTKKQINENQWKPTETVQISHILRRKLIKLTKFDRKHIILCKT